MIRQFFVDDAGECSCMRLLAFAVLVVVLGMWVWGNLYTGQYIPLGYAEAGLITSAIAGKAVQARFEYGGYDIPRGGFTAAPRDNGTGAGNSAPAPSPRNLEEENI